MEVSDHWQHLCKFWLTISLKKDFNIMQFLFISPILVIAFVSSMVMYHTELTSLHQQNEAQVSNVRGYVVSDDGNKCTLVKG